MEITMVTRLGICVTAILGLIIAAMIFAIFDLYNKLKKCQDKLEERYDQFLDLKGTVNSLKDYNLNRTDELIVIKEDIENIEDDINHLHKLRKTNVDVQYQLVDRVDDLERAYACLADSQESLDDAMIDLEKYHDELVDFVMEVREDVQYCKAKMNNQKKFCRKCKKDSGKELNKALEDIATIKNMINTDRDQIGFLVEKVQGMGCCHAENARSANG